MAQKKKKINKKKKTSSRKKRNVKKVEEKIQEEPLRYKRVLLKLSGEVFQGEKSHGIDPKVCVELASQIKKAHDLGVEIAIVLGGGNIFRGGENLEEFDMDRSVADYMGMLATVIDGLALQNALEKAGVPTRIQTAIQMHQVAEPYIRRKAIRHLEKRRVVIFVAGTGNPFFTTDTAAALRAMEIDAQVLLKATRVDGVYSRDPLVYKKAIKYKSLKYIDVLKRRLKVMDSTAISLCMDYQLPILVFNIKERDNLLKTVKGAKVGTVIR